MKTLALNELPQLGTETKRLINWGQWSCYLLDDDKTYLLCTEGYSHCCNPRPQKFFLLTSEGSTIKEVDYDFYKNCNPKEVIRFEIPDDDIFSQLTLKIKY